MKIKYEKSKQSKIYLKLFITIFFPLFLVFTVSIFAYQDRLIASARDNIILRSYLKSLGLGGIDRNVSIQSSVQTLFINYMDLFSKRNIPEESVDTLILDIPFKEFKILEESRERALGDGVIRLGAPSVKGKLRIGNESYKVKIAIKGYFLDHLATRKWSLKLALKNSAFKGMRKFSLMAPHTRDFQTAPLIQQAMKSKGILVPRDGYVDLTVNGKHFGLMYYEEDINEQFTEASRVPYGPISKYNPKAGERRFLNKNLFWNRDPTQKSIAHNMSKVLSEPEQHLEFINKEKWVRYLGVTFLFRCWHGFQDWNTMFYYHPLDHKLEPISNDHSCGMKDKTRNLDFLPHKDEFVFKLLKNREIRTRLIKELNWWKGSELGRKTIENLNLRSRGVHSLLLSEAPFLGAFEVQTSHLEKIYQWLDGLESDLEEKEKQTEPLISHMKEDGLLFPLLIVEQNVHAFSLSIRDFDKKAYSLKTISLKTDGKPVFYNISNEDYNEVLNNIEKIVLDNSSRGSKQRLKLEYLDVRKNSLRKTDAHLQYSQFNYFPMRISPMEEIKEIFDIKPGTNTFQVHRNAVINITRNINLPEGFDLVIQSGAKLIFSEEVGLIVNGGLSIKGEKKHPIEIFGKTSNWGGIQVNNKDSFTSIDHLGFYGGKGIFMGIPRRGAFTLNGGTFQIKNSYFANNLSEDALNISQSSGEIDNIRIFNTKSDGLDSDFSKIEIYNSYFSNIGSQSGSDAIDISQTDLKASNIFISSASDKGFSIGENSNAVIEHARVSDVFVGLAAKDSSKVNIKNVIMERIGLASFMAYNKKSQFGGAVISAHDIITDQPKSMSQMGSQVQINNLFINNEYMDIKNLYRGNMKSIK